MNVLDYLRNIGRESASASSDLRFLALTDACAAMVLIVEKDIIRSRFSDLAHHDSRPALNQRMTGATPSTVLSPQRFELKLDGPTSSSIWPKRRVSFSGSEAGRSARPADG